MDVAERGFTVRDESGVVPVASVELEGPQQVRITLERPATGAARLLYADRRHLGRGCLHDSDTDIAEDCYEVSAAGHYPSAAIPELVGRPYPLVNWCVAFNIEIAPEHATWQSWSRPQQRLTGRNTLVL